MNEKVGEANKELKDFEEKNQEAFFELKKVVFTDTYEIMGDLTLENVNIKSFIDRLQGVYGNGQTYEQMSQSNKDAVNILFQGKFQYIAVDIMRHFTQEVRAYIAKDQSHSVYAYVINDKESYVSQYIDDAIMVDIRQWEPELGLVDEYAIRIFGQDDEQFVASIYTYEEIKSKDFSNVRKIDMLGVTLDEYKAAYIETIEDQLIEETYNSQTILDFGVRKIKFEDITIVLPNGEATTFDDPRKNEVPYYYFREVGKPDRRVVNKRVQSAETTDASANLLTPEDIEAIEAERALFANASTPTTGSTSATAPTTTSTTGTTASAPTPSSGTSSGY